MEHTNVPIVGQQDKNPKNAIIPIVFVRKMTNEPERIILVNVPVDELAKHTVVGIVEHNGQQIQVPQVKPEFVQALAVGAYRDWKVREDAAFHNKTTEEVIKDMQTRYDIGVSPPIAYHDIVDVDAEALKVLGEEKEEKEPKIVTL